jgi:NAD(P)-dependent dehydrogenase (short-subunit alcohol dehydrogenase family)
MSLRYHSGSNCDDRFRRFYGEFPMDLSNRVALVTGASRGLGAAIARALAGQGAKVAINYFNSADKAENLATSIRAAGGTAKTFGGDVRDEHHVERMIREIIRAFGPVEILVPNATGPQPMLPIEKLSWQDCLDQLEFFVKSPLLLVKGVLDGMKERRHGRIIQIGSEVFEAGSAPYSSYVSAKGAQLGLTRSWAKELGPWGITVNIVSPGWIPTERHGEVSESDTAAYASRTALQRMGVPDDVGRAVAFLASDAAGYITGQKISVNGGNTLE